jgi:transketolase
MYKDKYSVKSMRFGWGEGLVELGKKYPNVVALGADITDSVKTSMFQDAFPDRYFSIGIAEQNMACIAAGLALAGKIPYFSTYGVFVSGRAWDQIRTTICYSNLNVKIGGAHGGISVGPDGATHQSLEEIAIMRTIPNMQVVVPCDAIEMKKAVVASAEFHGPAYIRFGREPVPVITDENTPFVWGKGRVVREGKDATIFACGVMVCEALEAADALKTKGVSVRVVNLHTVKPIDMELIVKCAVETGAVVTAEEHQVFGGFGSAVAEVVAHHAPVPMEFVGIMDRFGDSGDPETLMKEFHVTDAEIFEAVGRVVERKSKRGISALPARHVIGFHPDK